MEITIETRKSSYKWRRLNFPEALSFVTSEETTVIGSSAVTIFESDQKGESDLSAILDSTSHHGIRIDIPVENQRIGTFEGKLSWILADVPEN